MSHLRGPPHADAAIQEATEPNRSTVVNYGWSIESLEEKHRNAPEDRRDDTQHKSNAKKIRELRHSCLMVNPGEAFSRQLSRPPASFAIESLTLLRDHMTAPDAITKTRLTVAFPPL